MSVTRDAAGSMLRGEYFMGAIVYRASRGTNLGTGTVLTSDTNEEEGHNGKNVLKVQF